MKRISKIILCTLTIALVMCTCVAPCFAAGVYPTQNNTLTGIQDIGGFALTFDNCEAIAQIVEYAYKLNYFSSGIPVAIVRNGTSFQVLVVPYVHNVNIDLPIGYPQEGIYNYDGITPPLIGTLRNDIQGTVTGTSTLRVRAYNNQTNTYYPFLIYNLNQDNTFYPYYASPSLTRYYEDFPERNEYVMSIIMTNSLQTTASNIIALRYGENDWRTPYAEGYDEVSLGIQHLLEWYENQIESTIIVENVEYQLDIPGIITAIPNGAKQIINNAFGFEIFGINVAGLLSVLLVVTIVAFVVKWLMSR